MYSHQRSKVTWMWKIVFVECCPFGDQWGVNSDPNNTIAAQRAAQFFLFKHVPEDAGSKHVKVKKWQRQDILHFCADERKLILPPPC